MNYKVEMLADGTIRIGAPGAAELFSFVQLSDSHLRVPQADLPWTGELAEAMLEVVRRANALQPDFIASVREAFPEAALFVRSYDRRTAIRLADSDIAFQVRELRESAIAMSRAALAWIDTDESEIDGLEGQFRDIDMTRLRSQAKAGDLRAGQETHVLRGRYQAE